MPRLSWIPQTEAAVVYAERLHRGQRQGDGTPYVLHPLEVARLLHHAGAPDHLIAAGVLHDVLEKSDVPESDLRERFGGKITALVVAVSDDDRIAAYARRKAALRQHVASSGDDAMALFAADKISKVRELRRETALDGEGSQTPARVRTLRTDRLRHYQRSLAMLEEHLPESPLVEHLRHELDSLMRQRTKITAKI